MAKVSDPAKAGNITLTSEGRGPNARRIVRTDGWELSVWGSAKDGEPRIRDIDLAERLGFDEPRAIRKLIKRNFKADEMPFMRDTVSRMRNRQGFREVRVTEYWLTESEALFIATRSRTPKAEALTKEMIRVYVAVRRGLLEIPARSPRPTLRSTVDQLGLQVGQLAAAVATIAGAVASLTTTVQALAERPFPGADAPPLPPRPPRPALPAAGEAPKRPWTREEIDNAAREIADFIHHMSGSTSSPPYLIDELGLGFETAGEGADFDGRYLPTRDAVTYRPGLSGYPMIRAMGRGIAEWAMSQMRVSYGAMQGAVTTRTADLLVERHLAARVSGGTETQAAAWLDKTYRSGLARA